jgi:hypothetical protein
MAGFVKGDRVVQPQYGSGTIVEVNEHHTVIDFDTEGVRRFVTRLVSLERSGDPAPRRAPAKRRVAKKKPA